MQQFIKKTIIFSFLLFLSFSLISLFNYQLFRLDNAFKNKSNANILLLGDSNMQCGINDSIFKSSINKAASAESYFYSYLKLKDYISSNQKIDTVFLSFSPHNIFDNGWLLNDEHIFSSFKNYYYLMDWKDFTFLYKRNPKSVISSFPPIIYKTFQNAKMTIMGQSISDTYGGFVNLDRNILEEVKLKLENGEPLPFFAIPDNFEVSNDEVSYLDKIIELCQKSRIKLYLINLPKRIELLNYKNYGLEKFYNYYDSHYENIDFLDFSHIEMPDSMYGDFVHLNKKGSAYFSEFLEYNSIRHLEQQFGRIKSESKDSY